MNIQEIKAKIPEVEVYELSPDAKYVFFIPRDSISEHTREQLCKRLTELDIKCVVVLHAPGSDLVRLLEIKE